MTGNAARLRVVRAADNAADRERLDLVRGLLRPEFLAEAWDPGRQVFAPPRDHPLLGLRKCAVVDCEAGVRTPNRDLCRLCLPAFKASSLAFEEFAAVPAGRTPKGERLCLVPGCERPAHSKLLCGGHYDHWTRSGLSPRAFAAAPGTRPLPSRGSCAAVSCDRGASGVADQLCAPHQQRWRSARAEFGGDIAAWLPICEPISVDHEVVFRGLAELVQMELLLAVQERNDAGARVPVTALRAAVAVLRRTRAMRLHDLDFAQIKGTRHDAAQLGRLLLRALRRRTTTPEQEREGDSWDLAVFGLRGNVDFTGIAQDWLRECAKRWVEEDLPKHRGRQAASVAKCTVAAVGTFAESLRLGRTDAGADPAALGRRDVVAWTNRLAYLHRTGALTEGTRLSYCRRMRRFLVDIRALGLTRPGGSAAGLPDDVILAQHDIPAEPDDDGSGRDLPPWVLRVLDDHLPVLAARSGEDVRRMVELLIDTGRRPDEVCQLRWDCLTRDASGKPVLIYTDSKNHRPGRRLPIADATAQIVADQQQHTRRRFPATPLGDLPLFPKDTTNPTGTKAYNEAVLGSIHRRWVDIIAPALTCTVTDRDGTAREEVFDPAAVFPYAYRHSYAQRHADEGVAPDVLRDLLGHDAITTTLKYYRVTEKRVRAAVDRVSAHQFDGQGRRVFLGIRSLLGDEHARMRVGQVAVPFGICTEPSNVKAAGQACPYKFTCLGCGHFRSDPSYLPELKSYLQQLLADREHVHAATDLQDWAKARLAPHDEEITQLRALIHRIEADLDDLSPEDRTRIAEAVAVLRTNRQTLDLGMPHIRPPTAEPA